MLIKQFQDGFTGTGAGSDVMTAYFLKASRVQTAHLRQIMFSFFPVQGAKSFFLNGALPQPVKGDVPVTVIRDEIRLFKSPLYTSVEII
jgi:hypothetical protein